MIKRAQHKQGESRGVGAIVLMPYYGEASYIERGKLGLPMRIDREDKEAEDKFLHRVDAAERKIAAALKKLHGMVLRVWRKTYMRKFKVITHDYWAEAKEPPQYARIQKTGTKHKYNEGNLKNVHSNSHHDSRRITHGSGRGK